jgi:uncharacterized protein
MPIVDQVVEFSRLLRARGIRVSVSENMDAVRALGCLDVDNLQQFRSALRCSLIKQPADFQLFEELFDLFFLGLGNYLSVVSRDAGSSAACDEAALRELLAEIEDLLTGSKEELSRLAQAVLSRAWNQVDELLERAIRDESQVSSVGVSGYGGRSQRIIARLGLTQLLDEFEGLRAAGRRKGFDSALLERFSVYLDQQVSDLLGRIHQAMRAQQSDPVATVQQQRFEHLDEKSFAYYTQEDIQKMREVVARLALRFKSLLSLRQRKEERGRLDVKKTLRRNQQYGGVPFSVQLRKRKKEKPQVMVLCDISDSVMNAARFMLQFVYSLQELYSKVRSFVFVSDLGEVTQLFSELPINRAVDAALKGDVIDVYSHSNFGRSFKIFYDKYFPAVNHKTTVVVLGDGRNNYHPANDWVLREIQQKAKRLIWLNPESRLTWGLGDSEMPRYLSHCDWVEECRNIQQLSRVVGRLMP